MTVERPSVEPSGLQDQETVADQESRRLTLAQGLADLALAGIDLAATDIWRAESGQFKTPKPNHAQVKRMFELLRSANDGDGGATIDKPASVLLDDDKFMSLVANDDRPAQQERWMQLLHSRKTVQGVIVGCYEPAARLFSKRYIPEIPLDVKLVGAIVGIIEAIDLYDPSRNVPLITFIRHYMLHGMQKEIQRVYDYSINMQQKHGAMRYLAYGYKEANDKDADHGTMMRLVLACGDGEEERPKISFRSLQSLDHIIKTYFEIYGINSRDPASFDALLPTRAPGESNYTSGDVSAPPMDVDEDRTINRAVALLPPEEQLVIRAKYFGDEEAEDLVCRLGAEELERALHSATQKLRALLAREGLDQDRKVLHAQDAEESLQVEASDEYDAIREMSDEDFEHVLNDQNIKSGSKIRMCCVRGWQMSRIISQLSMTRQNFYRHMKTARAKHEQWAEEWFEATANKRSQLRKQAMELILAGVNYKEVAERTGYGYANVTHIAVALKEDGRATPAMPLSPEEKMRLRAEALASEDVKRLRLWMKEHPMVGLLQRKQKKHVRVLA